MLAENCLAHLLTKREEYKWELHQVIKHKNDHLIKVMIILASPGLMAGMFS